MGKPEQPDQEVVLSTAAKTESWLAAVMSPHGPAAKYRALCFVLSLYMGDVGRGKATQADISKAMGRNRSTVNELFQGLEGLGWIERDQVGTGQSWALLGFQAMIPNSVLFGTAPARGPARARGPRAPRRRAERSAELRLGIEEECDDGQPDPPPGGGRPPPRFASGPRQEPAQQGGEQTRPRPAQGGRVFQQPSPEGGRKFQQPSGEAGRDFQQPRQAGWDFSQPLPEGSRFFRYLLLEFLQQLPTWISQLSAAAAAAAQGQAHPRPTGGGGSGGGEASHSGQEGAPDLDLPLRDVLLRLPDELRAAVAAYLRPRAAHDPAAEQLDLGVRGGGETQPPAARGRRDFQPSADPDEAEIAQMQLAAEEASWLLEVQRNGTLRRVAQRVAAEERRRVLGVLSPLWRGERRAAWTREEDGGAGKIRWEMPWGTGDRPRLWAAMLGVLHQEGGNPYKILRYVLMPEEENRWGDLPQPDRPAVRVVAGTEHAAQEERYDANPTGAEAPGAGRWPAAAPVSAYASDSMADVQRKKLAAAQWKESHPTEAAVLRKRIRDQLEKEADWERQSERVQETRILALEEKAIVEIVARAPATL